MDAPRPIPEDWLSLREGADARARAGTRESVRALVARHRPDVVVDVGTGTGAGSRWSAPLLDGDEQWVLIDHDPALLRTAASGLRAAGARGGITEELADLSCLSRVLDEHRRGDASVLVITSALLDLLTEPQLTGLLDDVASYGVPLVAALTVTGGWRIDPDDPEDDLVRRAFDGHQRRGDRLGPQAADRARALAEARGLPVRALPTPWLLDSTAGARDSSLIRRLLTDRVEAAAEELDHVGDRDGAEQAQRWLARRLDRLAGDGLSLRIDHVDLLIGGACGT